MKKEELSRMLFTLLIACAGGLIFHLLHLPIAWLLGSMTAVLIGAHFSHFAFYWPVWLRNIGIMIVGYSMGLSFTKEALIQIGNKLPSMLIMTLLIILFSACTSILIAKFSGIDYPTALIGSIPGGLSQMVLLAEELENINLTVVTFLQVARLTMIILIVPFLIFGPFFGQGKVLTVEASSPLWRDLYPNLFLFAIVAIVFSILCKKIKLPTPFLLGPIFGTAILGLTGITGPELPMSLLDVSQLLIGINLGLMMKPGKLPHKARLFSLAILSGIMLIGGSLVLSYFFMHYYHFSAATSFLSLAPGGMDQMAIMAHEVQADLSIVTGYQLFRLFFIFFVVPPFLKWIFRRTAHRKGLFVKSK